MNKLGHVYVNLCERSFLSKHVRKNKVPLIADFVLHNVRASGHQRNNKTQPRPRPHPPGRVAAVDESA